MCPLGIEETLEVAGEDLITMANDRVGKPMQLYDLSNECIDNFPTPRYGVVGE